MRVSNYDRAYAAVREETVPVNHSQRVGNRVVSPSKGKDMARLEEVKHEYVANAAAFRFEHNQQVGNRAVGVSRGKDMARLEEVKHEYIANAAAETVHKKNDVIKTKQCWSKTEETAFKRLYHQLEPTDAKKKWIVLSQRMLEKYGFKRKPEQLVDKWRSSLDPELRPRPINWTCEDIEALKQHVNDYGESNWLKFQEKTKIPRRRAMYYWRSHVKGS